MGKGENAGNQHFLLFPQYFLPYQRQKSSIELHFILSSANVFSLVMSKILQSFQPLQLNRNWYDFCVKLKSVPANTFSLTPFRLLRFCQRWKNCDVFGMFCQALQQTMFMYHALIDNFSALIGRRKEVSFIARFGENRCKISGIMAASLKRSADVSDVSPKKKPTKHIRYQEYCYEYGEELHKKLQFFWHTI